MMHGVRSGHDGTIGDATAAGASVDALTAVDLFAEDNWVLSAY